MPRPTLRQVFLASLAGTALLLGLLFSLLLASSRRSLLGGAEALRDAAARRAAAAVDGYLRQAETPLRDLETDLANGLVNGDDPLEVERRLLSAALSTSSLAEVTFTHARPPWQVSLVREVGSDKALRARHTRLRGGAWRLALRQAPPGKPLLAGALAETDAAAFDPTTHLTYVTPAGPAYGRAVWTDLHYTELDEALPVPQRRVVVTVMKSMEDPSGRFVGVLRAGLRAEQLDSATRFRVDETRADDPHRVFVADERGRLVTRLGPADRLEESGDDVRVDAAAMPPEVALALTRPELEAVTPEHPAASGAFAVDGRKYLVTFRLLESTQDWRVAVLVPEAHYTAALAAARNRLLLAALGLMVLVVAAGALLVRSVQRSLGQVVRSTARMEGFDFQPAPTASPFRDLEEVQQRLERAKTALRAMGSYVPVDLVRLLYASGREPVLGGELVDVSLMFTDVEGFTTLAEGLTPDELGAPLGSYLEAMTGAVHATGGTVDKYIGDAVMALWNAPLPVGDHARRACRAALALPGGAAALFASPGWGGRPPLVTRFGLHRDHGDGRPLRRARPPELHRPRRRREPGLAPGGAEQALRHHHTGQRGHPTSRRARASVSGWWTWWRSRAGAAACASTSWPASRTCPWTWPMPTRPRSRSTNGARSTTRPARWSRSAETGPAPASANAAGSWPPLPRPRAGTACTPGTRSSASVAMRAGVDPARRTGGLPPLRGFAPRPPIIRRRPRLRPAAGWRCRSLRTGAAARCCACPARGRRSARPAPASAW